MILTLVLLALAGWGVAISPLFAIRDIRVTGAFRLTEEEVKELSGVRMGENLVRLPIGRAAAAVEGDPWIAEARIARSLPGTVLIEVEEHRPVGWIRGGGARFLVAVDGTILERVGRPSHRLPFVGAWRGGLEPGAVLSGPPPLVRVAASLPPRLRRAVARMDMSEGGVGMRMRTGEAVRYGTPDRLEARNAGLLAMLQWAEREGVEVEYYDVRVPDAPALRPEGERRRDLEGQVPRRLAGD